MSRHARRGRPPRHYHIRVRTERRDPIDYAALAQAALEQAAIDQRQGNASSEIPPRVTTSHQVSDPDDDEGGSS